MTLGHRPSSQLRTERAKDGTRGRVPFCIRELLINDPKRKRGTHRARLSLAYASHLPSEKKTIKRHLMAAAAVRSSWITIAINHGIHEQLLARSARVLRNTAEARVVARRDTDWFVGVGLQDAEQLTLSDLAQPHSPTARFWRPFLSDDFRAGGHFGG